MKRATLWILLLVYVILLAACIGGTFEHVTGSSASPTESTGPMGMGRSMSMMGQMRGMMARHLATIPDEYAGLANPVSVREPFGRDSLVRGEEIYKTYCSACHGEGGMGDGPAGESLDPAPSPLAHTSHMLGDDYLFWRISEGGAMEPFNSAMTPWKGVLDEEARWDVINYIRALGGGSMMPGRMMRGTR